LDKSTHHWWKLRNQNCQWCHSEPTWNRKSKNRELLCATNLAILFGKQQPSIPRLQQSGANQAVSAPSRKAPNNIFRIWQTILNWQDQLLLLSAETRVSGRYKTANWMELLGAEKRKKPSGSRWTVLDTTDNLTRSGTIEFVGPAELARTKKFGQELHWIRAEVVEGEFQSHRRGEIHFCSRKTCRGKAGKSAAKEDFSKMRIWTAWLSRYRETLKYLRYMPKLARKRVSLAQDSGGQAPAQPSETEHDLAEIIESLPLISIGPCLEEAFLHPKFMFPREIISFPRLLK